VPNAIGLNQPDTPRSQTILVFVNWNGRVYQEVFDGTAFWSQPAFQINLSLDTVTTASFNSGHCFTSFYAEPFHDHRYNTVVTFIDVLSMIPSPPKRIVLNWLPQPLPKVALYEFYLGNIQRRVRHIEPAF
jgi:hypothetical protein